MNGPRHVSSNTVGTQSSQTLLEARVASIDEEIRSLLTHPEPALQPFYGMMLYHLGLDAGRPRGGKRLRPLLCQLVFEALAGAGEAGYFLDKLTRSPAHASRHGAAQSHRAADR